MLQRQFVHQGQKLYKYYSIVEPYYEDGKNKKRVVARLGRLDDQQAQQIKLALKLKTHSDLGLFGLKDVGFVRSWEYLNVRYVLELIEELKVADKIEETRAILSPRQAFVILLTHQILDPGSKLHATRWLESNVLGRLMGIDEKEVESQHLYRALDAIEDSKVNLEQHLYGYLLESGSSMSNVFYDMSSSYFEGTQVESAAFNRHSKDHRPDRLQVQLGLLVNESGVPFSWDLFEGNIGESPTMIKQVKKFKKRFNLQTTLLVFDRGFLSEKNLQFIQDEGCEYLTGLDKPQVALLIDVYAKELVSLLNESNVEQLMKQNSGIKGPWEAYDENKYYLQDLKKKIIVNAQSVALSFDVERFRAKRFKRGLKIDRFKTWVEKHNRWLSHFKKDADRKAIENDVDTELKRLGLSNHVRYELHEYSIDNQIFIRRKNNPFPSQGYTRKVKTLKIVFNADPYEKTDGFFALITSLGTGLSAQQMVFHYREKNKIEEAFRNLKSLLKLRPWFVYKEQHVRAHYTICVVAYFIKKIIDQKLNQAGLKDKGWSTESFLKELASLQLGEVSLGQKKKTTLGQPSPRLKTLLRVLKKEKLLNISNILKL